MIVEHQFVTVLDGPIALAAAQAYFENLGFTSQTTDENAVQLSRGSKKLRTNQFAFTLTGERALLGNYNPVDFRALYQQARVEFDRGRVTIAVSILDAGKPNRLQQPLLTAAASGLEQVLVHHAQIPVAREQWDQIDAQITEYVRRRKRRKRIALIILLVILISPILLIIIAALFLK